MWPQTLQMTKEECRGILRRLELESYSNVISVFRAQGGLNETKVKVLEELRSLFHISQERHRAESRRVANDEVLTTIADAISGPNTWQEWSREGRRPFPMLPRVAPQTALALIANNIAKEVEAENAKLSYPTDTGVVAAKEQSELNSIKATKVPEKPVKAVTSDPFKVPDIPPISKKNLKRNMPEYHYHNTYSKKRLVNEHAASKIQQYHQQYQATTKVMRPQLTTPPSNIRKLYNSHTKMQQQQQQLLMQQQHQIMSFDSISVSGSITAPMPMPMPPVKQPKLTKKAQKAQAAAAKRNSSTSARGGRRQSKAQQQQQQLQQQQQQLLLQAQQSLQFMNPSSVSGSFISPADNNTMMNAGVDILGDVKDPSTSLIYPNAHFGEPGNHLAQSLAFSPKKDMPKMFSKLQAQSSPNSAARLIPLETNPTHQQMQQNANTLNSPTSSAGAPHILTTMKVEKQQLMSPVQKYIVEDRQAPLSPVAQLNTSSNTSGLGSPGATPALGSPGSAAIQLMTLPQMPSTRLRPVNAQKITGKRTSTATATSASLYEEANALSLQSSFNPTETSQILATAMQSSSDNSQGQSSAETNASTNISKTTNPAAATPSKLVPSKIVPLLMGSNNATLGKIEPLNPNSLPSNIPSVPPGTIIKSLPASVLLSGAPGSAVASSSSSTLLTGTQVIPSLGPGTTIFRKAPNILKSAKSSQFISNFKLTPVSTPSSSQPATFIKNISTTGLRANVKICQSPNGKVFIQPANLNDSTKAKLQTANATTGLHHKIIPTIPVSGITTAVTAGAAGVSGLTPQRIAIQKVQIIPGTLNSPGGGVAAQKPTTLKFANNNNMIFVPASSANSPVITGRPITISKTGIITSKPSTTITGTVTAAGVSSLKAQDVGKSNLVVIGSGGVTTSGGTVNKLNSLIFDSNAKVSATSSTTAGSGAAGPMITEDTPVDILNMPMIVQGADCGITESDIATAEALTALAQEPKLKRNPTVTNTTAIHNQPTFNTTTSGISHSQQHSPPQDNSMVVIGPTDWELELDQAAAATTTIKKPNLALYQQQQQQQHLPHHHHPQHHQQEQEQIDVKDNGDSNQSQNDIICSDPIIIDESYTDDMIVEEPFNAKDHDEQQSDIIVIDDMKQSIIEISPPTINPDQLSQEIKSSSLEDCFIVLDDKGDQVVPPSNEFSSNSLDDQISIDDGEEKA